MELITEEEVLRLHQATLAKHGGSQGLRDAGALDTASNQPRASFGGVERQQAHRPFGNGVVSLQKRHDLPVEEEEAEFFILCVASGEASREELVVWIRDWAEPLE